MGFLEEPFSDTRDGGAGACEAGGAAVVIKEADGKEGTHVKLREDVGLTDGGWYAGQV